MSTTPTTGKDRLEAGGGYTPASYTRIRKDWPRVKAELVFLISQPRAGSTHLQHLIASHPEVHAPLAPDGPPRGETWLLLHPVYALRARGWEAEYAAQQARNGLGGFLATLPG